MITVALTATAAVISDTRTIGPTASAPGATAGGAAAFNSCPRHVRELYQPPAGHHPAGATVPTDPIAAQVCVYFADRGVPTALLWAGRLSQVLARTMTLLLDQRGGTGFSCDVNYPTFVRLKYQPGQVVSLLAGGCGPEYISTASALDALPPSSSLGVSGLIDPAPILTRRLLRVPNYIGQPLASAARRGAVPVYELAQPRVPFGQVVWQQPLPGPKPGGSKGGVDVVVAAGPQPQCRAAQLQGRGQPGEPLTGDTTIENIELIDTSPHACSLQGRITLHGIGHNGRADTRTASQPIEPVLVLSPNTTPRTLAHDPSTALIGTFSFAGAGEYNGGPCPRPNSPSAWSLTLSDHGNLRIPAEPDDFGRFATCHRTLTFAHLPNPSAFQLL
jgi:hypothetical protein